MADTADLVIIGGGVIGTSIAELITEAHALTVDIRAFRPERFAEGQRIEGRHPYAPRRDHVEPTR